MSESDTAILLPAAKVAIFSHDAQTLKVAEQVAGDWRFARVEVLPQSGDVVSAAAQYQETASPDLLIVQTDTIDDEFTNKLATLAGACDEGTAAIVVGPDNDVNLYRKLIDMGVSDYLVRPLQPEALAEVIAKALIDRLGISGSHLVAFIGAKGGVGTSSLTQAAAWGAADVLGQKTLLIDPAGGWSVASVGIGFEPSTTLTEAVRATEANDEDSLTRMLFKASDKLSILASGGDVMLEPTITADQFEALVDHLMVKFPAVFIDLSHTPPDLMHGVISKASQIVVVSSPSVTSMRLARSLIHEIKDLRGGEEDNINLVINMLGAATAYEVPKNDIEKAMDFKPSAFIPYSIDTFAACESESKKLLDDKNGQTIVKNILLPVLQKTLGAQAPQDDTPPAKESLVTGLFSKLKAK